MELNKTLYGLAKYIRRALGGKTTRRNEWMMNIIPELTFKKGNKTAKIIIMDFLYLPKYCAMVDGNFTWYKKLGQAERLMKRKGYQRVSV